MDKVNVGKIINTFGIKGELKVLSSTDFPDVRFQKGATVYIQTKQGDIEKVIGTHRVHKGYDLISFENERDINLVEKYKGCILQAIKDESLLDEDEYYISDIIGCDVYNNGDYLGKVTDLLDHTYQDILVVEYKNKKLMIPYVDAFIKNKDIDHSRIDVSLIKGFIDED